MNEQTPYKDRRIQADAGDTNSAQEGSSRPSDAPRSESRRRFLGNVPGVAVAAATVGAIGLEPLLDSKHSAPGPAEADRNSRGSERAEEEEQLRIAPPKPQRRSPHPPH